MLKLRRVLFMGPILSFPIMCTLETGFLIYIMSMSASVFALNYTLSTPRVKRMLNIPEFLPGTKLEKMVILIVI
jgi:hypothetical protein